MLLTLIVFFAVLSILVLVHELGHFLAAKKFGIKIEEFGFGLPPRLFSIKHGETIYSINLLPIGGFVKLYGEEEEVNYKGTGYWQLTSDGGRQARSARHDSSEVDVSNRAFFSQPKWQRAIVLCAGVAMNFLLAVLIISYVFTQGVMVAGDKVLVKEVISGSPAAIAKLKVGDAILKVNDKAIKTPEELTSTTKQNLGKEIKLEIERCESQVCQISQINLTPRKESPSGQGPMGVAISNLIEKKYSLWQAPVMGLWESLKLSGMMANELGKILIKLVKLEPIGQEIAGPIGIAQATGEAMKYGWLAVLQLAGLISLNLALINILPFPALDGGRLLFVAIETVIGRKVKPKLERWAHQIGMIILLSLIVLITVNDLLRIFHK